MNKERLNKLAQDNIRKKDLSLLEEDYDGIAEGVFIVLLNKGVITPTEYEEIVNTEELYTSLMIKLDEPNKVEGELTILEITDRDGWILDTKGYETNVFDPKNPLHKEVSKLIQMALARKFKVSISYGYK